MKLQFGLRALACFLVLGLGACSQNKEQKAAARVTCVDGKFQFGDYNGIIGGEIVDKNSWLAHRVVFLLNLSESSICTGLLVDSNIVLTAAHCADSVGSEQKLAVIFSAQPECAQEKEQMQNSYRMSNKIILHPNWNPGSTAKVSVRGDIALIRFSGTAPRSWETVGLTKLFIDPRSRPTLVAGFGNTVEYQNNNDIPLMLRATTLNVVGENILSAIRQAMARQGSVNESDLNELARYFEPAPEKEILYFDQTQGRGICSGDSGGASFSHRDGKILATGIASFVQNPLDNTRACHLIGAHTSVFFHQAWIEQSFQALRDFDSRKTSLFE